MSQTLEKEFYEDPFIAKKNNIIICISLNIKGLKVDKWKAKNEILQDFLLQSKVDLIRLQEININWNKVEYKDR